jgi:hypothetical protein
MRARDWVAWSPSDGPLSRGVRDRINEQVAHLSRCREAKIDWDLRSVVLAFATS